MLADALLAESPETLTSLGLDKGTRAAAKSQLGSASRAEITRINAILADHRRRLRAIPRARLTPADQIELDSVLTALDLGLAGARFDFGDNSFGAAMGESARPYTVTQSAGAAFNLPEFLDSQHQIATTGDAQAYIARLARLAPIMDEETARIRADTAAGVIAPDYILDNILTQLGTMRAMPAAQQKLVASVTERARAKGIAGDWDRRAEAIVAAAVYPALDRQIAALREARGKATHDAGVWKLKDGAAYYAWLLEVGTTTRLSADEIHKIGLAQDKEIEAKMDVILKGQG